MPKVNQAPAQLKARFSLEKHLLLAQFMAGKIGLRNVSDFQQFRDANEDPVEDGRSYMHYRLLSQRGSAIPTGKLGQYDDNIKKYFKKIKRNREREITSLKYFQYLALLFGEIYLDSYFQNPIKFLNELNDWSTKSKSDNVFSRTS